MAKIRELFSGSDVVLMVGGSMLYIDAVCKGIDDIPTIDPALRAELTGLYEREGLEPIRAMLRELDPVFYGQVDLNNGKRVLHAVEVCRMAGVPYSSLRTNQPKKREFRIVRIGLNRDREELYSRIDRRVDAMLEGGLVEEVRSLWESGIDEKCQSMQGIGYKEVLSILILLTTQTAAFPKRYPPMAPIPNCKTSIHAASGTLMPSEPIKAISIKVSI